MGEDIKSAVTTNLIPLVVGLGMFYMLKGNLWKAAGAGIAGVAGLNAARQITKI